LKTPALVIRTVHTFGIALLLAFALLLIQQNANAQQVSESVEKMDDDSQLSLTVDPKEVWPGSTTAGRTVFTGRLYHQLSRPQVVTWKLNILDSEGHELNSFTGRILAGTNQHVVFTQAWDGTDNRGNKLAPGTYQTTAFVRLVPRKRAITDLDFESVPARVRDYVEASFATYVGVRYGTTKAAPILDLATTQAVPNEPGFPFNFYYGSLHTQTSFTDGGHPNNSTCASSTTHVAGDFTPAMAYDYARNIAHVDFLGISDHNHLFENACPGCPGAQVIQRYHDGLNAAAAASVDGAFVGIYGMEWGYISNDSFPMEGHVNLYEVPKLFGWESGFYEVFTDPAGANYPTMYSVTKANPSVWGSIGGFNHPATTTGGDFNNYGYTADGDDVIATTAVISGPASGFSTTQADTGNRYAGPNTAMYPSWATYDTYNRVLGAGFHVAPVADSDVHCSNYGTSVHDRTGILATSLTKANIMDALKNRRVFATSDANVQLVYTLVDLTNNITHYMGEGSNRVQGPVPVAGQVKLHVSIFDPDPGTAVASIKIFEPVPNNTTGQSTLIASGTTSPFDYTFTPPTGKHTYYVYATMASGAEMWSAPIWINASVPTTPDFSVSATPSSQTVTQGASTSYTATVTPSGGFTGTVTFSASGLPAGASASFNPASVTTSGSSTMTVTTASTTPVGSYPLTITGTSGTLSRTAAVTLLVQAPATPDFSLSTTPSSVTVTAGSTANYTENVTRTGGFTGSVSLSISGLPAGAAGTFTPNPNTGASSALAVTTSTTTPPGTYPLTITGTSGTLTRTSTATLVVQAAASPDFTVAITPTSRTVTRGTSTTYTVNITRTGGFTGTVTFSVSGLGTGASGTFSPNPATANSSTLTVTTTTSATANSRVFTVTGTSTSPALTKTATATLVVSASCNGNCD
jgi:hypothetical protein